MATLYLDEYYQENKKMYHGANVMFDTVEELDSVASDKEGRPVYKSKEIILVQYGGGDKTAVEVNEQHKKEYAEKYAAFKAGQEQPIEGTPISEWTLIPKTAVLEFAHFGIRSVEQIAEMSDDAKRKIGTLSQYCKKATDWLGAAKSTRNEVVKLKSQNTELNAKVAKLEDQIYLLLERIGASEGTRLTPQNNVAA